MKKGLGDSNKKMLVAVMDLLALAVPAVGRDMHHAQTQIGGLVSLVMRQLGDSKASVRSAAVACLDACKPVLRPKLFVSKLPAALSVELAVGRLEALSWCAGLLEWLMLGGGGAADVSLEPLVQPLLDSLLHRSPDVRAQAERCLAVLYACGGGKAVEAALLDGASVCKPVVLESLRPMCDKAAAQGATLRLQADTRQQAGGSGALAAEEQAPRAGLPSGSPRHACRDASPSAGAVHTPDGQSRRAGEAPPHRPSPQGMLPLQGQQQGGAPKAAGAPTSGASVSTSTPQQHGRRSLRSSWSAGLPSPTPLDLDSAAKPLARASSTASRLFGASFSAIAAESCGGGAAESNLPWLFVRGRGQGGGRQARSSKSASWSASPASTLKALASDSLSVAETEAGLLALRNDLALVAHPSLVSMLFSKDLKRQQEAMGLLAHAAEAWQHAEDAGGGEEGGGGDGKERREHLDAMLDNLDVVLRFCWLRLRAPQRSPLIVLGR